MGDFYCQVTHFIPDFACKVTHFYPNNKSYRMFSYQFSLKIIWAGLQKQLTMYRSDFNEQLLPTRLEGLDADANYRVREICLMPG